ARGHQHIMFRLADDAGDQQSWIEVAPEVASFLRADEVVENGARPGLALRLRRFVFRTTGGREGAPAFRRLPGVNAEKIRVCDVEIEGPAHTGLDEVARRLI